MTKLKRTIKSIPFFLLLLPAFVFIHILNENFTRSLIHECMRLIAVYLIISIAVFVLLWLLFKEKTKAAVLSCIVMAIHFFYGSLYDFGLATMGPVFLMKYVFILPAMGSSLLLLVIYLRKTKRKFFKAILFFNTVTFVFLLWELILFTKNINTTKELYVEQSTNPLAACTTCPKPDIYLIIADEYAGEQELLDLFQFSNHRFYTDLKERNFHVLSNASSNYNATAYSMASMLNMGYLQTMPSTLIDHKTMFQCRKLIEQNSITTFLTMLGYQFFNYSFFDVANQKKLVSVPFFPKKKDLFTTQFFSNRLSRNIGFNLANATQIEKIKNRNFYNNQQVDSMTVAVTSKKNITPKFVYAHLALPHHPYFFDSTGNKIPVNALTEELKSNRQAYVNYLIYANKKLLELIDTIKSNSSQPPIIILMSDHGFKQFDTKVDSKYYFMNMNAVYFPNKDYAGFYNGMSNVNQFRVILNSQFGQHLSMLKDSSIFLTEP